MTYPTSYLFASVAQFNSFVARTTNALGVYSRTSSKRSLRALDCARKLSCEDLEDSYGMVLPKFFGQHLDAVLYAIAWGRKTGRFHLATEQMLDSLSGYQFAKLVVKLALYKPTAGDVVLFLNGRHKFTLPLIEA